MIEKLHKDKLDLQGTTVYDYNELTLQELLCKFFSKINECVDVSNQSLNFLIWLKEEGLPIEVQKEIEKMYLDGRLTEIINQLANDVKTQVQEIKTDLSNHKSEYENFKTSTNETLNNYNSQLDSINSEIHNLNVINVERFRKNSDGSINDDKTTIINAMEFLKNNGGGTLNLTNSYEFDEIEVYSNIRISGGGTVKGSFHLGKTNNSYRTNQQIDGLIFIGDKTKDAITFRMNKDFIIFNNRFFNYRKDITTDLRGANTHSVNKGLIFANYSNNCDYFFYSDIINNFAYEINDIQIFSNQIVDCQYCHIKVLSCDGIIIKNNTFFFPPNSSKHPTKDRNIHLEKCGYTIIEGNNCFESGRDGIYLKQCREYIVTNNNVVWSGARELSSGINIIGGSISSKTTQSIVSNNRIDNPTLHGIRISNENLTNIVNGVNVTNNMIYNVGVMSDYYGTTAIDSVTHYGIRSDNGNSNVFITNNNSLGFSNYYGSGSLGVNNIEETFMVKNERTLLFSGSFSTTGTLTLNKSAFNYNTLIFVTKGTDNFSIKTSEASTIDGNVFNISSYVTGYTATGEVKASFNSGTQMNFIKVSEPILRIYGVNY